MPLHDSPHFPLWLMQTFVALFLAILLVLTVLEVSTGVVNGVGFLELLVLGKAQIAFWGSALAALTITCIFFGQRMAKDYGGAAVLVPYFLLTLVGLWLTQRIR